MKKKYKIAIVVVVISLLIFFIIFSCKIYFENNEYEITITNFELERKQSLIKEDELNDLINEKLELEESLNSLEKELSICIKENENLGLINSDLELAVKQLETEVQSALEENKDMINSYNLLVKNLEEHDYSLIVGDVIISTGDDESHIIQLLGQPNSESVEKDKSTIWYHEGRYGKTSIYDDLTIEYLGDKNGENYKVILIESCSDSVSTRRNIKIGDKLETLLIAYPMIELYDMGLIELSEDGTSAYYYYDYDLYIGSIYFEISDDVIIKIEIGAAFT